MWRKLFSGGEEGGVDREGEAQTIVLADTDDHYIANRRTLRETARLEPRAFGRGPDDTLANVRHNLRMILFHIEDLGASEARTLFNEALRDPRVRAHPTVQEVTRGNVMCIPYNRHSVWPALCL